MNIYAVFGVLVSFRVRVRLLDYVSDLYLNLSPHYRSRLGCEVRSNKFEFGNNIMLSALVIVLHLDWVITEQYPRYSQSPTCWQFWDS